MKRLFAGVIAAVLLGAPIGAQVQPRPNFSGRWVQVTPADGAGQEQVVKHDADKLSASHDSEGGGHLLEYKLDGSETTQTLTSHGEPVTSRVRASWDKESLVITTTTNYGGERTVILRQAWSLDKSGQLVILVSPTVDGKHQSPITVVYAKRP